MRNDIKPNERAYSTKEVAEEVGIATPTVRKYGQILERNGYEFLKDGDRRIFVESDIKALIALRDTDKALDITAKEIVIQQEEHLEEVNETSIALPDTEETFLQDPNQLKEAFKYLVNELAAARELNLQLKGDMESIKTTVAQLQQDHHVISSSIGNSAQRTNNKIEKLTAQQKSHYETLLEQEKQRTETLQEEIQKMRDEQKSEWSSQSDFNKRLEAELNKRQGKWGWFSSFFNK